MNTQLKEDYRDMELTTSDREMLNSLDSELDRIVEVTKILYEGPFPGGIDVDLIHSILISNKEEGSSYLNRDFLRDEFQAALAEGALSAVNYFDLDFDGSTKLNQDPTDEEVIEFILGKESNKASLDELSTGMSDLFNELPEDDVDGPEHDKFNEWLDQTATLFFKMGAREVSLQSEQVRQDVV